MHVTILREHRLITQGPYRFLPHPSYSGLLLALAAVGLAMGDILALLVLTLRTFLAFQRRVIIEEKLIMEQHGEACREYCFWTWKLMPWIY